MEGRDGGGLVHVLALSSRLPGGQAQGPHSTAPPPLVPTVPLLVSIAHTLHNLEQEPLAALSLVENRLQEVAGCRVAVPVTHCNRRPYILGNMAVVLHQPSHHVTGWHEVVIVIVDGLQLTDMADTADGCAADATHALGHNVDGLENRIGMLVEQQVIVAEVRAGQVPVEVLGLDIEREGIGDELVNGLCDCLYLLWRQVCHRR
jgi:hypothetical protein